MPDVSGRVAVVTGATSGIGMQTALVLADRGARVVLACRSREKALAVAKAALDRGAAVEPEVVEVDLGDLGSVRRAANRLLDELDRVDILVNNAGVMGIPRVSSPDGFEMQLATNYLGHFALTNLIAGLLVASDGARVVSVASIVHWVGRIELADLNSVRHYGKMRAYAQSKLAMLLFTLELDRRFRQAGHQAKALAAHPGWSRTHLQSVGPAMSGNRLMGVLSDLFTAVFAQSAEMGALPVLRAATDPSLEGGSYIGPAGLLGLYGYPVEARRSKLARDEVLARRLFEASEEMTGVASGF